MLHYSFGIIEIKCNLGWNFSGTGNNVMKTIPQKIIFILTVIIIFFLGSCKKNTPHYSISDEVKKYFDYHEGSYWVYKEDLTGLEDSTYVYSYAHVNNNEDFSGMTRELITIIFKSQFINQSVIQYVGCAGPDYVEVCSRLDPSSPPEFEGPNVFSVAYFPGWQADKKNISPECTPNFIYFYKIIPSVTVNNVLYHNIIYSEFGSVDSAISNSNYYQRKLYIAKNIGIIKYSEIAKYLNINRSFSLLRHKVIQ